MFYGKLCVGVSENNQKYLPNFELKKTKNREGFMDAVTAYWKRGRKGIAL